MTSIIAAYLSDNFLIGLVDESDHQIIETGQNDRLSRQQSCAAIFFECDNSTFMQAYLDPPNVQGAKSTIDQP